MTTDIHRVAHPASVLDRSVKWTVPPRHIGAGIAESDLGTAPCIRETLRAAVDAGFLTYLPDAIATEAVDACSAFLADRYGWQLPSERIHLLPDVVSALRVAISWTTAPGDAVVVPVPAYMPFLRVPQEMGRRLVTVPLRVADGRGVPDPDAVEAALAGGGLLVLCNPQNPLGTVLRSDEMRALAARVEHCGARVFSDEIHAPVVYPGATHVPFASLDDRCARLAITATSASKGWNIPGLKCAQIMLSSDADQERWTAQPPYTPHVGSLLGAMAAVAAYGETGQAWLDATVARLRTNRDRLAAQLAARLPDVGFDLPQATYLAWLDFGAYRDRFGGESAAEFLARTAGVDAVDGGECLPGDDAHVRFNFALTPATLDEAIDRIATALDR